MTGNTPLMYAAMENKTLIIERMLELGCDIHSKNKVPTKHIEHYRLSTVLLILMAILALGLFKANHSEQGE